MVNIPIISNGSARPGSKTIGRVSIVNRSPVYYGWIVWGIATLGILTTAPAQNFTVAQFIDYIIKDFGLDRSTISALFSIGTLVGAFFLTWVGRKIDHYGNRRAGVMVCGTFAIAMVIFSLVTTPLMLFTVFIAVRGLGQGSLWLVSSTAISQWFTRRRGIMMSLTLLIFALFQTLYVPWLQRQLALHDWREIWILLSIIVACVTLPVTWALMRNRPEDFGLMPDGVVAEKAEQAKFDSAHEINWTLAEAKRTPIFWIFLMGRFISPLVGSGLVFHHVSIFASLGHTPEVAAQNYAIMSVLNAFFSILSGMMMRYVKPKYMLAMQMFAMVISLLTVMVMRENWLLLVYALSFGFLLGNAGVFDGSVWTDMFGRLHQGAIRGFVIQVTITGAAIGPILFGLSYDYLGGYVPVLAFGVVLCMISTIASLFARQPSAPPSALSGLLTAS